MDFNCARAEKYIPTVFLVTVLIVVIRRNFTLQMLYIRLWTLIVKSKLCIKNVRWFVCLVREFWAIAYSKWQFIITWKMAILYMEKYRHWKFNYHNICICSRAIGSTFSYPNTNTRVQNLVTGAQHLTAHQICCSYFQCQDTESFQSLATRAQHLTAQLYSCTLMTCCMPRYRIISELGHKSAAPLSVLLRLPSRLS
jgi:hypothetical protein